MKKEKDSQAPIGKQIPITITIQVCTLPGCPEIKKEYDTSQEKNYDYVDRLLLTGQL